ncbi:prolyl oligopeptidase family serine peptidase [Chondrinema litorale]|uniref:prolyl oligopeptidase family serine peptidase n=1 Tax=Chondrinema litorale TaxID=2994555 RepID=UPI002543F625|nr:prolyl oligopeptidase family serine peptidase [Chondrinema litorale]UZR97003.1 prolyl oligopeptidase family serine peptidase [Chondrinema litorale]
MKKLFLIVSLSNLIFSCTPTIEQGIKMEYPQTKKVDQVDEFFGTQVSDPYRWLEQTDAPEVKEWIEAENKVTFDYLSQIPYREKLESRLRTLWDYEKLSAPRKRGAYTYYYKNDGLQNQSVLYRTKDGAEAEEVFLDPNKLSEDGTTSLSGSSFTKDGSLFAYSISQGGSDWREIYVKNTESGELLEDKIIDAKFTGITWNGNEGFYYSSYDRPKDGNKLVAKTQFHKLYYHKLGTPQTEDKLVFGGEETPRRYIGAGLTEDERFLVITAAESTSGNELYIQDLSKPNSEIIPIVSNFENEHYVVDSDGDKLMIFTNLDAPNNRVVSTSIDNPTPETWKDLIPETENVLSVSTAGGKIFASYLVDAKSEIKQFDKTGKLERTIDLPGIGSAGGFSGEEEDTELYYTFTSFINPSTIYKYSIANGESELYWQPEIDFDFSQYETKQVFYTSKDGTKVPMFITYKKGIELNGKNPTYLYAYGGFNVSLTPSFSVTRLVWLEEGGIYAQPNLRGGGEYGEKWHKAGTKMQKQNVFDDFIAAAEYLKKEKYTSTEYLAISGGSNGGLLVGATMTQRPDLAKVAFPAVGVMDMLRYHKFTAGAGWAYDYGTADDSKEMFDYLNGYSPVHNVKAGTVYPATMVTTADHDDRVVPGHSFKFAAELQEKQAGDNPVLIRIETKAGHGAGKPTSKIIEEAADKWAFAFYNMGYETLP